MQTHEEHQAWVAKFERQTKRRERIEKVKTVVVGVIVWTGVLLYILWASGSLEEFAKFVAYMACAGGIMFFVHDRVVRPIRADIEALDHKLDALAREVKGGRQ
jgi:hypothetical protein